MTVRLEHFHDSLQIRHMTSGDRKMRLSGDKTVKDDLALLIGSGVCHDLESVLKPRATMGNR